MERQYIEEHQVVERYLQGRLTPDEQQAFEEAFLGEPEIVEQLELAERLQQGLRDLGGAGERESAARPRWFAFLSTPQYAAAASALLLVSLMLSATLYRENVSLQDARLTAAAPSIRIEPLVSLRSGDAAAIAPGRAGEWVVLRIDPGIVDYAVFRATLGRRDAPSAEPVRQQTGIEPDKEGYLNVQVPGEALTPGRYDVIVEGRMPDWPPDRPFDRIASVPLVVGSGP